jgi:hypothetical protein
VCVCVRVCVCVCVCVFVCVCVVCVLETPGFVVLLIDQSKDDSRDCYQEVVCERQVGGRLHEHPCAQTHLQAQV